MLRPLVPLILLAGASMAQAQDRLAPFTENVLLHVITHEMGHAVIREFDLPILAQEEVAADQFATYYLHATIPDRAGEIIRARVASWMLEADEESIFSDYEDDARRAGYTLCLLHGLDPDRYEGLPAEVGMTDRESAACRDAAPEIARSWRRILAPLAMPEDARVTEVTVDADESRWRAALQASEAGQLMVDTLTSIDWHSRITLRVAPCDGGAQWQRNGRTILVCDALIDRFEGQAARAGP
ncbi:MAG: DUF4344 domain-containing metallopeptidase [Pseudomonadota bacterium]